MFLARVEWLPVTSRSHGRHITDKCKISIMMIVSITIFPADTGIYILMFKKIFYRFLKLTILTVLLLLMFAFTFFMTFRQFHPLFDRSPFASPLSSIWKTVAMSIGELDYDDVFRQPTGGSMDDVPNIPFPAISHILWLLFVILMPILFGNLLVMQILCMYV